jgi:hypothetical protein
MTSFGDQPEIWDRNGISDAKIARTLSMISAATGWYWMKSEDGRCGTVIGYWGGLLPSVQRRTLWGRCRTAELMT